MIRVCTLMGVPDVDVQKEDTDGRTYTKHKHAPPCIPFDMEGTLRVVLCTAVRSSSSFATLTPYVQPVRTCLYSMFAHCVPRTACL